MMNYKVCKGGEEMGCDAQRKEKKEKITKPRYYLSELRSKLKLSQEYIARCLGMQREHYCRLESGSRGDRMDIRKIIKLANALNIDITYLVKEEAKYLDYIDEINNRTHLE